ncbi:D-alanyl-D-alanine carboxypeptidase family protein [Oerskovia sp. NPDC060287]|uniref:M15 family metallopeptidase n=1 Tax=Oerskovia sp. NPDC060287 TaxID=3347095 RepID=UPI00365B334D
MATTFQNGEIPDAALTRLSTGHLLRADAAAGFEALATAFKAKFGKALVVTDAYRPKAGAFGQIAIFEDRYPHPTYQGVNDRRGPWKGKYWWRRTGTAAAAVPGTSNHGWGLALDLGSNVNKLGTAEQLWLVANGPRFGWVWPTWARKIPTLEPWHYEFIGTVAFPIAGDTGSITTPTIPGRPAPITPEDDMYTDNDRSRDEEALRLLRLIVLAPSGHASPATQAEAIYVQTVRGDTENSAEARRQNAVLLGAIAPAGPEQSIAQQLDAGAR